MATLITAKSTFRTRLFQHPRLFTTVITTVTDELRFVLDALSRLFIWSEPQNGAILESLRAECGHSMSK